MLRPQPTVIILKQENMKEYEAARARWAAEKISDNSTGKIDLQKSGKAECTNDVCDRRRTVNERIGFSAGK